MKKTGVVIGLGEFGFHAAKALSKEGCSIVAVDINEKKVNQIKDYVLKAVVADSSQRRSLEQLIPKECDFIIVAIGNIEKSMITTLYLKEIGYSYLCVKAITDEHERILRLLGVENIIFPERDMALRVAAKVIYSNMLDYLPLSDNYSIAELKPKKECLGKTLMEIDFRKKYGLNIIAVQNKEERVSYFTPTSDYIICTSDILMVIGERIKIEKYSS